MNYGSEETELVAEEIEFKDPTFNYTIKGTAPKLSADNHETIPKLHRYFVPYSDKDDGLDIKTFIHMMRSILLNSEHIARICLPRTLSLSITLFFRLIHQKEII